MNELLEHAVKLCIFAAVMPFFMYYYSKAMWRRINKVRQLPEVERNKKKTGMIIKLCLVFSLIAIPAMLNQVIGFSNDTLMIIFPFALACLFVMALLVKEYYEYSKNGVSETGSDKSKKEIKHEKPKFNNSGLGYYAQEFTAEKRQVSNTHYYGFKLLCIAVITSIRGNPTVEAEVTLESGIMAIGGTSIMFAFLANSDKTVGWSVSRLIGLFILLWLGVEMFSAFAARMEVSNNHNLSQSRENKSDSKTELARLYKLNDHILKARHTPANEAALLAANERAIKKEKKQSKTIVQSDEQKLHSDIEEMTGVSNIGSIRYGIMAALYIMGSSLLIKMSGGLYCNWSLKNHLEQSRETLEIMQSCEAEKPNVIKSVTPADLKIQGTQKDEPTVEDKVVRGFELSKVWVESKDIGQVLKASELRKSMGTTIKGNQSAILTRLKKAGAITVGTSGNRPEYKRAESKAAVLSQFAKTKNFLNIVKK